MNTKHIEETIKEVKGTIEILEEVIETMNLGCDVEMQLESEKIKLWALEKQVPKKPILKPFADIMRQKICHHVLCPNCRKRLYTLAFLGVEQKEAYKRLNRWKHYCYECGQKLDWSVEDE